ncbi:MAG: Lipoprotein LpqB, beta-propeller domain-like protein [Frankiales bacterium]|nr:Lipoprotein LpqB, beta-propeller domain-like protein [Frankiales bacterium]
MRGRGVRRALAGLLLLLLAGCGLPLPEGVRSAGDVRPEQPEEVGIEVLPPGPQDGATEVDLVQGFLRAQSSPNNAHAVAREFLAPGTPWDDDELVIVYRASPTAMPDPERLGQVVVRLETVARISDDGSYRLDSRTLEERYTYGRQPDGQLRLTGVPPGLRLTPADRELSYRSYEVDFLALGIDGQATSRLVADRVFLPVTADPASAVVAAALRGPSLPLRGAVTTAAPPGTTLVSPVRTDAGLVTVDLSGGARALDSRGRQRLSAQLVWTLQAARYSGLRLLVEGEPFEVEGVDEVQQVSDWPGYDPSAVDEQAPLLFVRDRKLLSLDGTVEPSDATRGAALLVDEAAASPLRGALGLRTATPSGIDEIRTGPAAGPFGAPVLAEPELGSLSWGSGDQGLWVLQGGRRPVVWLVPGPDAEPGTSPRQIEYEYPPGASGPLTRLRVARDGTRVALVFGTGADRRLHVGRIEPVQGQLRIAGVIAVAPALSDVTDLAWRSGTSLAVLAADVETAGLLPVEVAIDGSSVSPVQRGGLTGTPVSLAAAPGRPLTVSALEGGRSRLFRDNGSLFRLQQDGGRPFYPG